MNGPTRVSFSFQRLTETPSVGPSAGSAPTAALTTNPAIPEPSTSNSSAPSVLERQDSGEKTPEQTYLQLGSRSESEAEVTQVAAGYFNHPRQSYTRHYDIGRSTATSALAYRHTSPVPAPVQRDWSFGSAWSWGSDHGRVLTSARFIVQGTGGHGTAAPLVSMAQAPENTGRSVVAGRLSLKVLQISVSQKAASPVEAYSVIEQVQDLRENSRLSKSYSINDVRWGYAATARKLVTGCSNGCVILWDLDSNRRIEQTKFEHDRAVNRVFFAGTSGKWMISAAQDGFCKLWDTRTPSVANLALASFSDPARDLSMHPSTSPPSIYSVCTLHESGMLQRWDLRRTNQPVDKVQAHAGVGLCIRWKGATGNIYRDEEGPGEGYLATSGLDKTVKIWKMGASGLPAKPLRTLYPAEPVARVAWRPGFPAELATIPLLAAGSGEAATSDGTIESLPNRSSGAQIDLWDVRRPYVPKGSLTHALDGGAAAVLFPDASTLWTIHKAVASFVQHDVERNLVRLDDGLPRSALGWASGGEVAFAVSTKAGDFADDKDAPPADIEAPAFGLEQELAGVSVPDLNFDAEIFAHLANHYRVAGSSFEDLCAHNAQVADDVNLLDAALAWRILARWFGAEDVSEGHATASTYGTGSLTSLPVANPLLTSIRRSGSMTPTSSPSRRRVIAEVTKLSLVPEGNDSGEATDDEDSDQWTSNRMSDSLASLKPSEILQVTSNSEAEDFFAVQSSNGLAANDPSARRQSSMPIANSASEAKSRSSSKSSHAATPRGLAGDLDSGQLLFAGPQARRTISPIDTDSDSEDDATWGPYGSVHTTARLARQQIVRSSSDFTGSSALQQSRSRARSRTRRVAGTQLSKTASALANLPTRASLAAQATLAKHQERETKERERALIKSELDAPKLKAELAGKLIAALKDVLASYAEQGDAQMCVTVMLVMAGKAEFDMPFRVRTTSAYLDLLRRFDLQVPAASVMVVSQDEQFRLKNTLSTLIHTACGRCRKGLIDSPHGLCKRCRIAAHRCTIWCACESLGPDYEFEHSTFNSHRTVHSSLLGICSLCGHAVHRECIAAYLQPVPRIHSGLHSRSSATTTPATSGPATPKFYFGGTWLWGTEDDVDDTPMGSLGGTPSPRHSILGLKGDEFFCCPSGCECSPCGVFQCLDVLPDIVA